MFSNSIKSTVGVCLVVLVTSGFWWYVSPEQAQAHCQVPCGIYDDDARIARMMEDYNTINKATTNIIQLAGAHDPKGVNQAARWVMAKEDHASNIIKVVSEYFLTQKVKPVSKGAEGHDKYLQKLSACHKVMVAAMKTKQDANKSKCDALKSAIEEFSGVFHAH